MSGGGPRVLFLFVDGIGIGSADPAVNPFFAAEYPTLTSLCGGRMLSLGDAERRHDAIAVTAIDANLGVEGLPQSGTGQTALYTGLNAPAEIGKHFGPYVYSDLRPLLSASNVFRRVQEMGKKPMFANAFPEQYFRYLERYPARTTATALAWMSTGVPFNDHWALREGRAVSADITNERWDHLGYPEVPVITPARAGEVLAAMSRETDFLLYEFYHTDQAGHRQNPGEARRVLERLDGLLAGICGALDFSETTLVVTSDHGNLEDLTTKSHTRNPVPLIAAGRAAEEFVAGIKAITGVTPGMLRLLH